MSSSAKPTEPPLGVDVELVGLRISVHNWSLLFFFNFWRRQDILGGGERGALKPCFGLLVTSALGFKAKVNPSLACFLASVIL